MTQKYKIKNTEHSKTNTFIVPLINEKENLPYNTRSIVKSRSPQQPFSTIRRGSATSHCFRPFYTYIQYNYIGDYII